jgi:hypothetical protein
MPDISMCENGNGKCKKAKYCYRHTAKPEIYGQTFMLFEQDVNLDECGFFMPNEIYKKRLSKLSALKNLK